MAGSNSPQTTPDPIAPSAGPATAEPNAGKMPGSFTQAILENYAWRLRYDQPLYRHQGVATFAPGDPVPSDHPAFAAMSEQGLLQPIPREGQAMPDGFDALGHPVPDAQPALAEGVTAADADAALARAGKA